MNLEMISYINLIQKEIPDHKLNQENQKRIHWNLNNTDVRSYKQWK